MSDSVQMDINAQAINEAESFTCSNTVNVTNQITGTEIDTVVKSVSDTDTSTAIKTDIGNGALTETYTISEIIPNSEIPTGAMTANSAEVLACSESISDSESSNMAETGTNTNTIEIASDGAQS